MDRGCAACCGPYPDGGGRSANQFAEARVSEPEVVTADDYLNAADILLSVNQYALAQRLLTRAEGLGADQLTVAIGMANASLALGDTKNAEAVLASVHEPEQAETAIDTMAMSIFFDRISGVR